MTLGRNEISLAHARALKLMGLARRLSFVATVFVIAALVAGTAGTSYAKSKKKSNTPVADRLADTVVISNYGAVFAGSLETFRVGVGHNAGPYLYVKGPKTQLGASTGPAGDSQSSMDSEIAVAMPIDFFDLTGCGPFGLPASAPAYGTGLVELFSPGANGNSAPDNIICSPNFAFGAPNTTGVFYPQGVAFESPYDGINPGQDIVAVANQFPEVYGPEGGIAACAPAPAPGTACPSGCGAYPLPVCPSCGTEGQPPCACGLEGQPPCPDLGTVTMYDRTTLPSGLDNVAPLSSPDFQVSAINPFLLTEYTQPATIGGCLALMAGPEDLTFDQSGNLFVVNNAGADAASLAAVPRYVTVYGAGEWLDYGDVFPAALMGNCGCACTGSPTAGSLIQPIGVTVDAEDNVYVTDIGDNSIKIFYPFTNYDPNNFFDEGEQEGEISGPHTKLKIPEGIALDADGTALYVVNTKANSLEMFTDFSPTATEDLPPTLIVQGPHSKMNLPVGVALPAFTPEPSGTPDSSATSEAARD